MGQLEISTSRQYRAKRRSGAAACPCETLSRSPSCVCYILFESSLRGRSADRARPPRFFRRAALSVSLTLSHFSLAVTEPYKLRAKLAKEKITQREPHSQLQSLQCTRKPPTTSTKEIDKQKTRNGSKSANGHPRPASSQHQKVKYSQLTGPTFSQI